MVEERKYGIKNKILLFFLVIIMLPILTLGFFSNIVYSKLTERNVNEHTKQMIDQIQNNIETYIKSVEDIVYYISKSEDVNEYMLTVNEGNNDYKEHSIKKKLCNYRDVNPEILGILLVNENDIYVSSGLEKNTRDPLVNEEWYKKAIERPDELQFFSNPVGRNIKNYSENSSDEILSISKAMVNSDNGEILGVVLIDINLKKFEEIIKNNYIGEKGFFYIIDNNNNIVYSPVNPIIYRINNEMLTGYSNSVVKIINNESFQLVYETSEKTGWKTIGVFSLNDILKDVNTIQKFGIAIGVVTLIIAIYSAIVFTNTIVTPLKEMNNLMKKAESGDLEVRFDEKKYKDEFRELGHSFNHMIKEIKSLIDMVYEEQKNKRKAEMKILQAQIKPHFLYNTLDTIAWMAEEYEAKDIVEVVTALTKVFRIALNKGREIINIKEEKEHVYNYLLIQKVRYEDKLDFYINCPEEFNNYLILKLTVQPIVENAIYHGIKQKRGKGHISIDFSIKEDVIVIEISDDGAGIKEGKLNEINYMLENDDVSNITSSSGSGFGIYNVNTRIKLTYGSKYGLKYYSEINKGTRVEIIIPIVDK